MTDKEKLEKLVSILIKRLYMHKTKADIGSTEKELFDEKIENAQYEECKDILNIIDSMQEEPVTSDFETALAKEWKGYNDRGAATVDALEDNTQELAFAKGFYRGWNYPKEKPVSEDLEKDIEKEWNCYSKDGDIAVINVLSFKLIAQHFIQWQKQQMMKEAFVYEKKHDTAMILASECLRNHGWFNREHDFNDLWQFICGVKELFVGEFKDGDKVKILVIKED